MFKIHILYEFCMRHLRKYFFFGFIFHNTKFKENYFMQLRWLQELAKLITHHEKERNAR